MRIVTGKTASSLYQTTKLTHVDPSSSSFASTADHVRTRFYQDTHKNADTADDQGSQATSLHQKHLLDRCFMIGRKYMSLHAFYINLVCIKLPVRSRNLNTAIMRKPFVNPHSQTSTYPQLAYTTATLQGCRTHTSHFSDQPAASQY